MVGRSIGVIIASLIGLSAASADSTEPRAPMGGDGPCARPELQDTEMALFEPDRYAWKLFMELSHPAALWEKCPDEGKAFGDDGPVVWETWRNIAPEAERSVFPPKGQNPGPWRTWSPSKFEIASLTGMSDAPIIRSLTDLVPPQRERLKLRNKFEIKSFNMQQRFVVKKSAQTNREGNEVRLNRDAYLFIRDEKLYDRDTLEALAKEGKRNIHLPPEAKEVKAQWQEIEEEDKPRYHWVTFEGDDGKRQTWGLTALHITTKDLPNWFWTTFEHVDTSEDWENPTIDAYACPDEPVGCDDVPAEVKGTKWENYRMRGSQTDFVDSRGEPIRLASSQIEAGIQKQSSCMTCHSEAAMDREGEHHVPSQAFLGVPKTDKLKELLQLDFMFAFERASSSTAEDDE